MLKGYFEKLGHNVTIFEFSGHGETPVKNDFSIAAFASELIQFVTDAKQQNNFLVFGYSMGGYVALHAALQVPQLFKGMITLATKFNWTPENAQHEVRMLNPIKIEEKIPAFAQVLDKRHKTLNWKENMLLTANMMIELGNQPVIKIESLKNLNLPVLYAVGDRDEMITMEETSGAYKNTPHSAMAVLPMTSHPIEKINSELLPFLLQSWEQCAIKYPTSQTND
jgi:pimeloyl-ACP methyl ester carboxylesterase